MRVPAIAVLLPLAMAGASCGGPGSTPEEETPAPVAAAGTGAAETAAADARPAAFAQCATCHQVEPGKHGVGPSLVGVFGAKAGHAEGFNYSPAMKDSGLTWDEATLDAYLAAPMQTVPGTRMTFAGLKNDAQRKQVIEYLRSL